ncbi:MAG: hypothetical protein ACLQVL_15620 [Terriglobia bacterium]
MTVDRRHFLKQAGSYLGTAAGISLTPSACEALGSSAPLPTLGEDSTATGEEWLNLSEAQLLAPPGLSPREERALLVMAQEVEKRTELRLPIVHSWPSRSTPVVVAGTNATLDRLHGQLPAGISGPAVAREAEGYAIRVVQDADAPRVSVAGADERGVLFGVGKLLRSLRMTKLRVEVDSNLGIKSSPKYRLRGHQLGYRPKTNSYDGWTVALWDQYIRELALFGCNFIELIPPRSDDDANSPHFTLPPKEMMIEMSRICDEYGLDVWIWYPAMERDYSDPATVSRELAAWGEIFKALPRVDAVFVPGGDPGHTEPKHLMALLEKQTRNLRQYHPQGQMWMSPQSFNQAWLDGFLEILKGEPAWLGGVVFGPQTRVDLPTLRKLVPKRYPMRLYPDITHTMECQFPVPDWDVALALTEGRESICPRPEAFANIARRYLPYSAGFGTYSEGCNDDVNKFIWSALAWDPEAKVVDVLRDYGHFFIGPRFADDFAEGLMNLEKAWQGPLLANENVDVTLVRFQTLERSASPAELLNWRFQQGLYRAYYDAYVRRRLVYETDLYSQALDKLEEIHAVGSHPVAPVTEEPGDEASVNGFDPTLVIAQAQSILAKAFTEPVAQEERTRILQLAEALFQSIRMQLAVERYQAESVDRGGNLDTVDAPLNNGPWLTQRLRKILALPAALDQVHALEELLNRTNPGPGGYYDALGDIAGPTRLVRGLGSAEDPEMRKSALIGHDYPLPAEMPTEWKCWAEALFDAPLRLHYSLLDPQARYRVRVVYAGDEPDVKIRLSCEGGAEIHPLIAKPQPPAPLEFNVPPEATAKGELTLEWTCEAGLGGNGRGTQVAEVWLLRKQREANQSV